MKNFILGLIIGIFISGSIAYAAITTKILLVSVNGSNVVSNFGTNANPIYITAQ